MCHGINHVELQAIEEGLKMVVACGFRKVPIESDSMNAIEYVKGRDALWDAKGTIRSIRAMLQSLQEYEVIYF